MIRRWCVYLAVLAGCLGLYAASPGWIGWIAVLTAAGSPLVSVAVSGGRERDALGLFRFPGGKHLEYERELRPYRCGDSLSRVHWKRKAKAGTLLVWEERAQALPKARRIRGIVPVALCFAILLCLFPPGQYDRQMHLLQGLFQRRPQVRLELSAGARAENKQAVLDVVASQTQLLYLRGQAYEVYDGESWQALNMGEWSVWEPKGTVSIAARPPRDMSFAPYGGAKEKPSKRCLQLPKETKAWAQAQVVEKTVEQIVDFVRSCAEYDENITAMPENTDFARWFIESGRGYCIHFATAAVVLLRAAGIPARLITGYAVQVQAGLRKTVTGEDAHAWAEYWDGESWHILEATPTVEAGQILPVKKENRRVGGLWVLILAALAAQELGFRKYKKLRENPRIKELQKKAAFSRDGLTEEEKVELHTLSRGEGGFLRSKKTGEERRAPKNQP